eukprot:358479-Chlamydomonas_euryale.AAC.1
MCLKRPPRGGVCMARAVNAAGVARLFDRAASAWLGLSILLAWHVYLIVSGSGTIDTMMSSSRGADKNSASAPARHRDVGNAGQGRGQSWAGTWATLGVDVGDKGHGHEWQSPGSKRFTRPGQFGRALPLAPLRPVVFLLPRQLGPTCNGFMVSVGKSMSVSGSGRTKQPQRKGGRMLHAWQGGGGQGSGRWGTVREGGEAGRRRGPREGEAEGKGKRKGAEPYLPAPHPPAALPLPAAIRTTLVRPPTGGKPLTCPALCGG